MSDTPASGHPTPAPGACPRVLLLAGDHFIGILPWRVYGPAEVLGEHGYPVWWERLTATQDLRLWAKAGDARRIERFVREHADDPRDRRRALALAASGRYDLVSVASPCPDEYDFAALAEAAHRGGAALIADLTDDLPRVKPYFDAIEHIGRALDAPPPDEWAACLRHFDGFTVANDVIAASLRALGIADGRRPVAIARNLIDADLVARELAALPRRRRGPPGAVVVAHAGSARPAADCRAMADAWVCLRHRYEDAARDRLALLTIGYPTPLRANPALTLDLHGWVYPGVARWNTDGFDSHGEYLRALAAADIGCCSVAPTAFAAGKTPSKAWEFALCGAAVIGSPTLYGETIEHERNGLLAETVDEWEAALVRLIEDEPLRRRLADRLRADVLRDHSLQRHYAVWPRAWSGLLSEIRGRSAT